jgi:hypothetical protein
MKTKGRLCSTGHDTGVTYRRGLHGILASEKSRKDAKRASRHGRRVTRRRAAR